MHASTDQILSLRDGGPVDARVREHVGVCQVCHSQLAEMRGMREALRGLPALSPPAHTWAAIAAQSGGAASRGGRAFRWLGIAVAAAMVAGVAILARSPVRAPASGEAAMVRADEGRTTTIAPLASGPADETGALVARSAELENALAVLSYRPRIVNAGTASTIAVLEDRLAMVDYRLSGGVAEPLPPGETQRLWRQRVDLMDSLVNVRYAQIRRGVY